MSKPGSQKKITLEDLSERMEEFATATRADIESLATMSARQFMSIENSLEDFKQETSENFSKVRKDIFNIKDVYATREELRALIEQM